MGRNLKYQFKIAIEEGFKPGRDKHSIKKEKGTNGSVIYSYADRKNLINSSANLANWLKENKPNIKLIKDIKAEDIQEFLNSKIESCSQATLDQYAAQIRKLDNLVREAYTGKVNFYGFKTPKSASGNQILRDKQLEKNDYDKLHNAMRTGSNGQKALELGRNFGLRVSEITKLQGRDINLDKWEVRVVGGKGRRDRTVKFNTIEQYNVAKNLKESVYRDLDRIVPVKEAAINMALNRAMHKLDIKNNYKETSFHSVRKLFAQEEYDRLRNEGTSIQEACKKVAEQLGHSQERGLDENLINRYIKNIW